MSKRRKTPVHVEEIEPHACSVEVRLSVLQQVPFFAELSATEIRAVNEQFREYGFQPGEPIYYSGEMADSLYVVAAGQVKLLRHSLKGQDVLLDVLKPGDYFGSLTTAAGDVYPDTAQAQTAVCALRIGSEAFRALLQQYPRVGLEVLDITARRLRATREMVRGLSVDSVEQRIAAVLLKLAHKLGETTAEGILIQMPLSRDDLAQMTGTTTETASRIVSQFQKEGLVSSGRQWIAISDLSRLKELAGTDLEA
jgi:CRP/FNR family transcriptional regulator, nitrogen oxide reductase regulator